MDQKEFEAAVEWEAEELVQQVVAKLTVEVGKIERRMFRYNQLLAKDLSAVVLATFLFGCSLLLCALREYGMFVGLVLLLLLTEGYRLRLARQMKELLS